MLSTVATCRSLIKFSMGSMYKFHHSRNSGLQYTKFFITTATREQPTPEVHKRFVRYSCSKVDFLDRYELLNKYIEKLLGREGEAASPEDKLEKADIGKCASGDGGPEVKGQAKESSEFVNTQGNPTKPSGGLEGHDGMPPNGKKNSNSKGSSTNPADQGIQGMQSTHPDPLSPPYNQTAPTEQGAKVPPLNTQSVPSALDPQSTASSQVSQVPPDGQEVPQSAQLPDSIHNAAEAQGPQDIPADALANQDLGDKPTIPTQEIHSKEELVEMIRALNTRIHDYEDRLRRAQSMAPFEEMSMQDFCEMVRVDPLHNEDGSGSFWPHTEEEQKPGAFGIQEPDEEALRAKPLITKEEMEKFEKEMVAKIRDEDGVTVPEGTSPLEVVPKEMPPTPTGEQTTKAEEELGANAGEAKEKSEKK